MPMQPITPSITRLPQPTDAALEAKGRGLEKAGGQQENLREKFDTFVGETFYGMMLKEMRKTVGKSSYFNGGRAEEVFRGQLDQKISQQMAKSNASTFTGPMFELFALNRK